MIAVDFPLPLVTCLSKQLKEVDISPSGNHVKLGWEMPFEIFFVDRAKVREGLLCQISCSA